MAKPFFFRIESAELLNFATDPEGEGMTLLRFAKELQRGNSDITFIQGVIDETLEFSQKKRDAANKRWSKKDIQTDAVHSTAMPEAVTEAVTEKNKYFDEFWEAFADKKGKTPARKSWSKINPDESMAKKIIAGAKRYAVERVSILAKGSTPKMAQGWLTDRRWEDETSKPDCVVSSLTGCESPELDAIYARANGK